MDHDKNNVNEYYASLAKKSGMRLITLNDLEISPELLKVEHCYHYLQMQAVPISKKEGFITIATSNIDDLNIEKILEFWDKNKTIKGKCILL